MKKLILIIFLFQSVISFGQNCDCAKEFDYLVNKIESDYAGFQDKITNKTFDNYTKFTNEVRIKAQKIRTFNSCCKILEEWLGYFNDKHLSIGYESNIYFAFKNIDNTSSMLRIPSFSWDDKDLIDTLILNNIKTIISKPILIIDLRGNGGGTDYSYEELLPLIYSNSYISKGVEYWASEGNISVFEKAIKNGEIKKGFEQETQLLLDSMRANKNSFYQEVKDDTIASEEKYPQLKLVGVIVDDFCASSCEQFVLSAKNSNKTIVFGTRTMGVLDYSNAVPENLNTKGLFVRYPMTRSSRLPENPVDIIGIQPDVEINKPINLNIKSSVDDWVVFVNEYLRKKLEINE